MANWARTAVLASIAFVIIGALTLWELTYILDLRRFLDELVARGGAVVVVESETGLGGDRCQRLSSERHVVVAGGVRLLTPTDLAHAPGLLVQRVAITEGALRAFDPEWNTPSMSIGEVLVGDRLGNELGLVAGSQVWIDRRSATVRGVVDTTSRGALVSRSVIEIVPADRPFDQCWVEFELASVGSGMDSLPTVFSGSGPLLIRPWLSVNELTRNPAEEFAMRPLQNGWPIAAVVLFLSGWIVAWFQRSDIALYRALGMSKSSVVVLWGIQYGAAVVLGSLIGFVWALALYTAFWELPSRDQLAVAFATVSSAALLALWLGMWAGWALGRVSITTALKDR